MTDSKENTRIPEGIRISRPILSNGSRVEVSIEYPEAVKRYFKGGSFFAEYNERDLSSLPESILAIPFLANLAPIAWALGIRVFLPSIDEEFLNSLGRVKAVLTNLYPSVSWGGEIEADEIVGNNQALLYGDENPNGGAKGHIRGFHGGRPALLFSGGLDSVTTFFNHIEERPLLITVWGSDLSIKRKDAWERVAAINRDFAERYSTGIAYIKSNFRLFYDEGLMSNDFALQWWEKVQYGLGLSGLCAPLSHIDTLDRIYFASSRPKGSLYPRGSHPDIVNNVSWSGASVLHDCDLSRQEKVKAISRYLHKDHDLILRVCWKSGSGMNCSRCEKCARTMVALAVEGIDPNNHGFRFDRDTLGYIRDELERGGLIETYGESLMWQDIQRYLPESEPGLEIEGLDGLFAWLKNRDFTEKVSRF